MKKDTNHDYQSIPLIESNDTNDSSSLFTQIGVKSHGTVTFPRNHSSKAKFIRIPIDASPVQVKNLFFRQHKQKRPSLVLTVIGSAKAYSMKSKLFQIFRQGLVNVAKTADIWIMTSAGTTCVSKLMGKIVRTNPDPSHPMYLVGISQWEYIAGVEQLDIQGTNVIYSQSTNDGKNKILLEPNHTHFILIDDVSDTPYMENVPFLGQLEKAILEESISLHIPIVLLVIKGGYEDLEKVHESVVKNKIPVVLLEGSGGCCDLFAKCYHLYNKYYPKIKTCDDKTLVINEDSSSNEQIKKEIQKNELYYFELIYECLQTRNIYLNFLDLTIRSHIKPAIDSIILQSFFNVTIGNDLEEMNIEQRHELLNLAFEWKRLDIVKNFIIQDDRDWKSFGLNDIFEKALLQNQIHFIQLFLDYDFPLDELFDNKKKILSLYEYENYQFKENFNCPLRAIFHEIIQPLTRCSFHIDAIFDLQEIDVEKELFLWSVLTGKQELALLFWARGTNKVCAALFATLLYKNKTRKEKDTIYCDYADEFQNLAVQILKKFYLTNPYECIQAIIREIPQFGNVTWLHLAVMAEAKLFIAERAVQKILRRIWYGHIDHSVGKTRIVLASFMLWYSGFLPYYKELIKGNKKFHKINSEESLDEFFQSHSLQQKNPVEKTRDPTSFKLMDKIFNAEENSLIIHNTNPWKRIKSCVVQYVRNILLFLESPYVKYLYNLYFHMLFLLLFSYVILCDFIPLYDFQDNQNISNIIKNKNSSIEYKKQLSISEIILDIWIFTLFCEEIRQITSKEICTLYAKMRSHFAVFWNKLDALAIFLFCLSFILRWLPSIHFYSAARIILAIDLSLWYIRTLDIFSAIKRLGPKLVMISEMVHDMKFYMAMITVFVLAYGVPAYSLLYGIQEVTWHIPRTILNFAYWPIFGELPTLEDINKNYEMNGYIVFILLIAYITITSVLLINLLIAMFGNTFERLQADTDCIWKFQHYSVVCYHLRRPLLPPPLVIFSHIYYATIYILSYVFKIQRFNEIHKEHKDQSRFKIVTNEIVTKKIETIEDALGNDVYYLSLKSDRKQYDFIKAQVYSSDEILLHKIKKLEDRQEKIFESLEYLMNAIEKIGGDTVEIPKQSRQDLEYICMFCQSY